jgi:hypothetical protein
MLAFLININVRVVHEHALANWKVFVSHTMSNTWNSIYDLCDYRVFSSGNDI